MAFYSTDFSKVFSDLTEKFGVKRSRISQYTHLDQPYLGRLKSGEKNNPSPETVIKISLALVHYSEDISLSDIERLFKATGRSIVTRKNQSDYIFDSDQY